MSIKEVQLKSVQSNQPWETTCRATRCSLKAVSLTVYCVGVPPCFLNCFRFAVFAGTRVVTIKREPLSPNSDDVNVVDDDSAAGRNGFASGPTTIVTR